jgi:hypothetical protein
MQAVGSLQPFDLCVNSELAFRLGLESDHNFADQPERSSKGEMPRSLLISNHVAEMVIEDINNLIIRDCVVVSSSYGLLVHDCTKTAMEDLPNTSVVAIWYEKSRLRCFDSVAVHGPCLIAVTMSAREIR